MAPLQNCRSGSTSCSGNERLAGWAAKRTEAEATFFAPCKACGAKAPSEFDGAFLLKAIVPKVRIVADYCSCGYQLAGEAARAYDVLPVSDGLLARLSEWNDRYESCDPQAYEDVGGAHFDFIAFAADGLEIARAVKRALPRWTVLYWDEAVDWFLARDPRSYVPGRCEYEIDLE